MRIRYILHTRFPNEKAHGLQVAQVYQALVENGHDVTLVSPDIYTQVRQDPRSYYGTRMEISHVKLPVFDAFRIPFLPESLAVRLTLGSYRRSLRTLVRTSPTDVFYARSVKVLPALLPSAPVILELHEIPRFFRDRFASLCNRCALVVCLTTPMRDELLSLRVDPQKVMVESDGLDPERFASLPSQSAAKEAWNLPTDRPVLGYCGSLVTRDFLEKGIETLLQMRVILKKQKRSLLLWIVGGPPRAVAALSAKAKAWGLTDDEIRFQGPIPFRDVPGALSACDVFVYPAPRSDHVYFQRDTSPLKLLEYLAVDRPIVCAALPPIRDIVDETVVHFAKPGDPSSFAQATVAALEKPILNMERRRELVDHYSWRRRMERIFQRFGEKNQSK